ncbi:MAG: glycosyltransferase family 2 protein [Bacteroidia bacterium]
MSSRSMFSIIVPTYNRVNVLPRALKSVVNQTYRPIHLIVVDDGSSDNTDNFMNEWIAKNQSADLLVDYIKQNNGGAGAARNTGISHIKGTYVQYLDSDDELHPERLSKLQTLFEEESVDFIQTGFDNIDHNSGEKISTRYGRLKNTIYEQMLMGVLWPNTLRSAFTTKLVKEIGLWNTSMICFEDREYVERAILHANKPICIREVLATASRHVGGNITDHLKTEQGRENRVRCEKQLVERIDDIPTAESYKKLFKSRMYTLSLRCFAEGWTELGNECLLLANSITTKRDLKNSFKKFMLGSGAFTKSLLILIYKRFT